MNTKRFALQAGLALAMGLAIGLGPAPALAQEAAAAHVSVLKGERNFLTAYDPVNRDGTYNVVIEIPAGTTAKYEVDKDTGMMVLEQKNGQPRYVQYLGYPANYGLIPRTVLSKAKGGDGDPVDVIALGPTVPRGSVVRGRAIGLLASRQGGLETGRQGLGGRGHQGLQLVPLPLVGGELVWCAGGQLGHIALEGRAHDPGALGGLFRRVVGLPHTKRRHHIAMPIGREGRGWRQVRGIAAPGHLAAYGLQGPALGQQGGAACACGNHHHRGLGQHLALRIQRLPFGGGGGIGFWHGAQAGHGALAAPGHARLAQQGPYQLGRANPAGPVVPAGHGLGRQARLFAG